MISLLSLLLQVSVPLPGQVVDLAVEPGQHLVYATAEGEVGRLDAFGTATVLTSAGSFVEELRAVAVRPDGDLSVLDDSGDLHRIPVAGGTPQLFYDDRFLIIEPTDLLVDADGIHLIACRTISANTRSVAHVSLDGASWSYLHVMNQPLGLAADPFGGVLYSDADGFVQRLTGAEGLFVSAPEFAQAGFSSSAFDGDLAVEDDGDVWVAAGTELRSVDRGSGVATLQVAAAATVRACAIAPGSAGGQSVWFTEGAGPTTLRELSIADVPALTHPLSFGPVPDRGIARFSSGFNIFDLEALPDGNLAIAGDIFGSNQGVRRVTLPDFQWSEIAGPAQGFDGRVEGLAVEPDGALLALQNDGVLRRVIEGAPTVVETVFSDPLDEIGRGKDLALGRGGQLWVSDFLNYASSRVLEILPGGAVQTVTPTPGTISLSAYPFGGDLIYSEWNKVGFDGEVLRLDPLLPVPTPLGGFSHVNWSNDGDWGDGDLVVDALGQVYTCAEDEFSVKRWDPDTGMVVRIGAGYLNRPSGLAIAPSVDPASVTGWSLYIAERNNIWELPGTPPPMGELLDVDAPPIGAPVGFVPLQYGYPTAFAYRAPLNDFLLVTDAGWIVGLPSAGGSAYPLVGPGSGIPTNLVGIAVNTAGDWLVADESGTVTLVLPNAGFAASTLFSDPFAELDAVIDLGQSPSGDLLLLADEDPNDAKAMLHRVSGGVLSRLGETSRGLALARDPLSGDLFAAERGRPGEGGELLRVELGGATPLASHWLNPSGYSPVWHGEQGGGLAFDGDGNPFIASSADFRVHAFDRATGTHTLIAGQLTAPRDLTVAAGRPGIAGIQGASLFVLDGSAVFEVGIDGPVPFFSSPPLGAEPEPLRTVAQRTPGAANEVHLGSAREAGRPYWILPGASGKEPGIPLSIIGDPVDDRILPLNSSGLWNAVNSPTFPNFSGVLDGAGQAPLPISVVLPDAPVLAGLDVFCDLAWFTLDFASPNFVGTVGNTAQIYLGP